MLNISKVYKTYKPKKGREVEALKDINLSIGEKGLVFLLGKSGSGKSTLMNIIGGLDVADQGQIFFGDKDLTKLSEKEYDAYRNSTVGFIFQEFNLIETFSVYKNVSLSLELQGKTANREEIKQLLESLDLKDEIDRMPYELSGGQKQRVSIARALVKEPKIILADEPTGSLDSDTGKQIFEVLKKLSLDKLVIVVSHDRDYAEKYGDRIIELSDGKIIRDTDENHITDNHASFELTPSKMPMKDAFMLGFAAFIRKPVRMVFTLLLLTFAFLLFGVLDSTANYNLNETVIKDLYQRDQSTVVIQRTTYDELNGYDSFAAFGSTHFSALKRDYSDFYMKEVLPDRIELETLFNPTYGYDYFTRFTSGIVEIDQTFLDQTGFSLVGRLPLNINEIVIPYHLYESYEEWGYNDNGKVVIHQPSDLLGKHIHSFYSYTIVGVLDTDFNQEKYRLILDESSPDEIERTLYRELTMISDGSLHTYMYVVPGFIQDQLEQLPPDELTYSYLGVSIYDGIQGDPWDMNDSDAQIIDGNTVMKINSFPEETTFIDGFNASELSGNQVIIPIRLFRSAYFGEIENNFEALVEAKVIEVIDDFAETHYDEKADELANNYELYSWQAFSDYIQLYKSIPFFSTYMYGDFESQAEFEVAQPLFDEFGDYFTLSLQNDMHGMDYSGARIDVEVVGYYFGTYVLVSEDFFDDIKVTTSKYPFKQVIVGLSGNQQEDLSFLNALNQREERFEVNNEISHMMLYMNDPIIFFQGILLWIALGLAFFSGLLFYNFMSVSIHHKKKEVGILRALGARRRDVFMIFLSEALIIASIVFLLSFGLTYLLVTIGNHVIVNYFGLGVDLLWVKARQLFTILSMNVGVALMASYIPIYKFAKEKPIDTIKVV
ncbi:MAG: ABC transporter ATP-binding protein/permease [Acholeplasmataceae bacterium]|jgi:ABC-type lipoprotein export system ATPase subunit|nr:ABC transporter ATP-binding protein/permease [Acholeplasmataceae bacterium]